MFRTSLLFVAAACIAGTARSVSAQQGAGPLATLLTRAANPGGPFARNMAATDAVVARAREQVGRSYRFAASSPDHGFDCSGLVKYVLQKFGVDVPHNAARMAKVGEPVASNLAALRPGDLLMFGRGRSGRISHVGIYVGDGRMVHASTSQHRVVETEVPFERSSLTLRTVRRVLRDSTTGRSRSE